MGGCSCLSDLLCLKGSPRQAGSGREGGSDTSEAEGSSLVTRDGSLKFRNESLFSIQRC